MTDYQVKSGETLWGIVKKEYNLTSCKDIANVIKNIEKANNLKNVNIIQPNQKLKLPDNLDLSSVSIMSSSGTTTLKDETGNHNYYRANTVFGDIATKKEQYPNQEFQESKLKKLTQSTEEVESVQINVKGYFSSETARDAQAYDIAAKVAGVGGFSGMNGTDAYNMFLKVNDDDFTMHETEYKGKKETKAYFDAKKSDGIIKAFGSEIINGKEYLTLKDNDGKIHYFDMENKLKEVDM